MKKSRTVCAVFLLVASILFFIWEEPKALLYVAGVIFVSYGAGLWLEKSSQAKAGLAGIVAGLIFLLLFFKYGRWVIPNAPLVPLGFSYYSLMAVGYLIDVYRGDEKAEHSLINHALFLGFFPQITAGPIGRSRELFAQYRKGICPSVPDIKTGLAGVVLGVMEKYVIADNLRMVTDHLMNSQGEGAVVVLAMVLYSLVIYYDFCGYSHIAIGVARVCGVRLAENFRAPYFATTIQDFWRRWHISLSTWFRDYLYIPLGGSRHGALRRDINTMIVFIASGAWHGTMIGYWIWGFIHGIYLVAENHLRSLGNRLRRGQETLSGSAAKPEAGKNNKTVGSIVTDCAKCLVVFLLVSIAWVPFYAGTLTGTASVFKRMWSMETSSLIDMWRDNKFGLKGETWLIVAGAMLIGFIIRVLEERSWTACASLQQSRNNAAAAKETATFDARDWCARHGYVILILGLVVYTAVLLVGVYGTEYDAASFIYGGF